MSLLRDAPYRFIVFCDDLSFDAGDASYKSLKAALEGGVEGRPANVLFYATSNRRHLMPREMMENERSSAINPGEAVEEKVSLSDRFGLWLGFHHCSQDDYLAMVHGYAKHFGLDAPADEIEARGARMGDDARLPLGPHRLAVHPGSGGTARQAARRRGPGLRRTRPNMTRAAATARPFVGRLVKDDGGGGDADERRQRIRRRTAVRPVGTPEARSTARK